MPTTTPFANLITFSRGSNATVVGPNGLIQWAPSNIHTFSEQFDNAAWSKTNATVIANQNVAGGTLGSELAPAISALVGTNDNFSGSSGSFSNGVWSATCGTDIGYPRLRLTIPGIVIGRRYVITLTATLSGALSSVRARLALGGSANDVGTLTTSGSITGWPIAAETNTVELVPQSTASGSFTVTITSISVREVTPAAGIAPDGTWTADTLLANAGTGFTPRVGDTSLTTVNGAVHTASVYVRPVSYTFFQIYINNQGAEWANFTLTGAGTATANGSCTAAIQALSDGWYRVSITYTAGGTDRRPFYMLAASATATRAQAWNPNGSEAVLLWGAQLELGSAATTYNPTTVKNLLGFSEAFDNAAWAKTRASIVPGAAANPINGLFNAQKLMEDTTASNSHFTQQTVTLPSTPQTISAYVRSAGRDFRINLSDNTTGNAACTFNLSAGTAGAVSLSGSWSIGSASITSLGSGWYRVALTATRGAGTQTVVNFELINSGSTSYTGDGNSGVFIYGAQLSDSASLDPYVPTPGAAPSSTAYYGPRFDYDPVTLAPRGLLIEEQRTNLLLRSEEFDNASWAKSASTVTANATTSPDGTVNAEKLVEDSSTGTHSVIQSAGTVGVVETLSVFAKQAERQWLALQIGASSFGYFNLSAGTVGTTSGATATITNFGNGWYRCAITATRATTTNNFIYVASADATASYTGNGTSGIFIYGAQLEAGAFATSYIPTIASTVTRSADVATISGSLFSQWWNAPEGAFVVELSTVQAASNRIIEASAGTSSRVVDLSATTSGGAVVQMYNGTAAYNSNNTFTLGSPFKTAGAYRTADYAVIVGGGTVRTDNTALVNPANALQIGRFNTASNYLNGHIRSIRYYPVRAADFQLQALTA